MSRGEWVIPEGAGVKDFDGNPRALCVRLVGGRVVLCATLADDTDRVDTRTWLSLPDDIADMLGVNLRAGVEQNRQLRGEV